MPNQSREYLDETGVALLWAKVKSAIAAGDTNTTYTISQDATDGHKFTLTGSDNSSVSITIPDNFGTSEQTKLAGIAAGAEVNVQSNWNESNSSSDAYILNKPTIPTATSDLTNDSDFVSDANYVHTDSNFTAAEKTKLSNIASGAEVNVQSDWNQSDNTKDDYIKNKPSIPTKTSDLTNDSNYVVDASYVHTDNNYSTTEKNKLAGIEAQANKTTVDDALNGSSTNPVQNKVINSALALKAPLASPALTGTPTAPTADTSTNNTQIATTAFVKNVVAGITGISFVKVNSYADLPATGAAGTIYLVPHTSQTHNIYDEYIWTIVSSNPDTYGYELIGTTQVDLSDYMKISDWNNDVYMTPITSAEIDTICV